MNLHKILIRHCAPKDSKESMVCWVIAINEQEILTRLDKLTFGAWTDRNEEDGQLEIFDEHYKVVGTETYLEKMARVRGEFNDPDASYDEAYYGITHYGWSEPTPISVDDAERLIFLGVAEDWREPEVAK